MSDYPETSTTLLRELVDSTNDARWREFIARYRPMMESFLNGRYPGVDAEEVIQTTLIALVRIIPTYRYDPQEKGPFHSYLLGILRNQARKSLTREAREAARRTAYAEQRGERMSDTFEARQAAIFEIALQSFLSDESVSERTKQVVTRVAIQQENPEAVAASLGMTRNAVDQAKSRALTRLREIATQLMKLEDE